MQAAKSPPYRIQTPRLLLRCWDPADVRNLLRAIAANIDHLSPWMPWVASEPEPLPAKLKKLRDWRARFDQDREYFYGIFLREDSIENEVIGAIGRHSRIGDGAAEIGYWIDQNHIRQGLMTEAAGALTRLGFEFEKLRRMEIHCDPANAASWGVAKNLGYQHALTLANCVRDPKLEPRDTAIWAMTAQTYPGSAASCMDFVVFDAAGDRIGINPPQARL
jgi:RimJ/RimL family protein N-acetyltransferase